MATHLPATIAQPPHYVYSTMNEPQKKKRRPGKCARRRKRKAQAILDAAAAAFAGGVGRAEADDSSATACAITPHTAVPSDRGYTLEGAKVRRREERERRRRCRLKLSHVAADGPLSEGDLRNADDDGTSSMDVERTEGEDDDLDPRDERALRSQLGFVPGNAVRVAARLPRELVASGVRATCSNDDRRGTQQYPQPAVVELYPMAVRESYRGGKTDGRAFKGRRRGNMRAEGKDDEVAASEIIASGTKKRKKDRAWLVESSANAPYRTVENYGVKSSTHDTNENDRRETIERSPTVRRIIEPFPTLYWLTSPLLRTQISKLEISKGVPAMEDRLRSNPEYLRQMERAHISYGRRRWELLTVRDRTDIVQRGWKTALDDSRGVAGIRLRDGRYDCVKCLHAHAAHYLAQVAERRPLAEEEGGTTDTDLETAALAKSSGREKCDGEDLNLVGKWTMEAVLGSMKSLSSKK